jgi:hypothetical protein
MVHTLRGTYKGPRSLGGCVAQLAGIVGTIGGAGPAFRSTQPYSVKFVRLLQPLDLGIGSIEAEDVGSADVEAAYLALL